MPSLHWSEDFEHVRSFLIEAYSLNQSLHSWTPIMSENIKFRPGGTEYQDEEDEGIKVWEDIDDSRDGLDAKMVAVTIAKSSGSSWIQIHPDYRFLERELVSWLEKQVEAMGDTDILFMV
ncbi:MAG: hypothetical protein ACE5H4_10025 [Candidatus Thorarchaeota archaeon]